MMKMTTDLKLHLSCRHTKQATAPVTDYGGEPRPGKAFQQRDNRLRHFER